ncbi:MAG: hypothetical protein CMJ20_03045 [Phycisphaeraceae bacterium]|nr:hypothetical protein [Phycisphaeraceae bacterium]|tara:strand:+ start:385 stop:774 length:390 start_codon:yes stop_codon:yes gene_type:complete
MSQDQLSTGSENQEKNRRNCSKDRRQSVVDERLSPTGFERRRGPGRRRSDFMKRAEEGEMTTEQFLFVKAMDAYKRSNNRPYPSWTEVLEVIRKLGYRKTCSMQVQLDGCEDWQESSNAPIAPQQHEAA